MVGQKSYAPIHLCEEAPNALPEHALAAPRARGHLLEPHSPANASNDLGPILPGDLASGLLYRADAPALPALRSADNLRELHLGYNLNLKSLDGLETLSGLERLYIGYTSVTDLEPLRGCRNLRRLELTYLDIDDYSPIQDCPIEMLDVHRIPQEDVELLREMFPDAIISAST